MANIKRSEIKGDIANVPGEHSFGEKPQEWIKGKAVPTYESLKYKETKKKVVEMLDSGKYAGLNDSYFWILMHYSEKANKVSYDGLIISHDGMKIINDNLPEERRVKAGCFSMPILSDYQKDTMYMYYQDEETIEFGEISKDNCKNAYPYAMLFKRTYDRVVKDKAKMYGVYSEEEADEFKRKLEEPEEPKKAAKAPDPVPQNQQQPTLDQARRTDDEGTDIYAETQKLYSFEEQKKIMEHYKVEFWYELPFDIVEQYYKGRRKS